MLGRHCRRPASHGPRHPDSIFDLYAAAVANAKAIAGGQQLAPALEYVGGNTGAEGEAFQAVYQAFTDATGTVINYGGTGSSTGTNATIQSRVQAGNPPDLADMTLGVAKEYAKAGDTLDLTTTIGADELAANYSQSLLDSLSNDGKVFGVPQGFSTFMVWYNPKTYTGPTAPKTWQEVVDWTNTAAAAGQTPWCIAEEAGAGSGFPGTQWIESLFGKMYGPEMLAQWSSGELPWTSDQVKAAWEAFGSIADRRLEGRRWCRGLPVRVHRHRLERAHRGPADVSGGPVGQLGPGAHRRGRGPRREPRLLQIPGDVPDFANTEIFNAGVDRRPQGLADLRGLHPLPRLGSDAGPARFRQPLAGRQHDRPDYDLQEPARPEGGRDLLRRRRCTRGAARHHVQRGRRRSVQQGSRELLAGSRAGSTRSSRASRTPPKATEPHPSSPFGGHRERDQDEHPRA